MDKIFFIMICGVDGGKRESSNNEREIQSYMSYGTMLSFLQMDREKDAFQHCDCCYCPLL